MVCFCTDQTFSLLIEADYVIDPIWCSKCHCNIDMDDLPLSQQLKKELSSWSLQFGKWRDKDTDKLIYNAYSAIKEFNERGIELLEKVKLELGDKYTVEYVPSA